MGCPSGPVLSLDREREQRSLARARQKSSERAEAQDKRGGP